MEIETDIDDDIFEFELPSRSQNRDNHFKINSSYRKRIRNCTSSPKKKDKMNLNFNVDYDDYTFYGYHLKQFQETVSGDFFSTSLRYSFEKSQFETEKEILSKLSQNISDLDFEIQHVDNYNFFIRGKKDSAIQLLLYSWTRDRKNENIFEETKDCLRIKINGSEKWVAMATKALFQEPSGTSSLKWYYLLDGRMDYRFIDIHKKYEVYDEMYPWIKEGVENYFKRYLDSDANILVMIGEPGSGKTSLIRELLVKHHLSAMITYEEELMNSDRLYMDLMTGDEDVLIMEDADLLLLSREMAGNKLMSKLLNISDGLLKNKRKIIFTANMTTANLKNVDAALLRPGRCFDVLNFREYTKDEAEKICNVMNISLPNMKNSDTISLAKLTNKDYVSPNINRVGFL